MHVGTVKKLLRQIEQEHSIRVDEAKIEFPISSADSVRFLKWPSKKVKQCCAIDSQSH